MKNSRPTQGKRVILFARKNLIPKVTLVGMKMPEFEDRIMEETKSRLEFLGIVGHHRPSKNEIPDVNRTLRGAGIRAYNHWSL
jgi:sodium/potassium-transporting ATPase subunit alpha